MMVSIQCTKKRLQLCLKILLIVSVIGIYFIVLLRESFAAWESSSLSTVPVASAAAAAVKNGINGNGNHLGDEVNYCNSIETITPSIKNDETKKNWTEKKWMENQTHPDRQSESKQRTSINVTAFANCIYMHYTLTSVHTHIRIAIISHLNMHKLTSMGRHKQIRNAY